MEGGNHEAIGKSGERGALQFMAATWEMWSKEVSGRVLPFNKENEWYVALKMVDKWIAQGLTDGQIALMWNQGSTGPCRVGTNRYGVKYNSCEYRNLVLAKI